ncbi:MAG: DNA helicase UvrD [Opitutae bacterium]|nr:DNA helicase UvrD [Opitutae bacterium]|tara:strand:- start:4817 stop:6901 length:2085 start_codon:yes stop_codon:yes gene_type:complete
MDEDVEAIFGSESSKGVGGFPSIDFRADLNDDQYRAVTAPDGPALVLAGAGSGKTRTLTYRVAYLITERAVQPHQILLLTFTNKAANQMLGRVESLTGIPSHKFLGGTFHHVGQNALRHHGESVGLSPNFTILDDSDSDSLLNEVIRELDPDYLKNKNNPKAKPLKSLISYARNVQRPVTEVVNERYGDSAPDLAVSVNEFQDAYRQSKLERGLADFDDLLEYWLEILERNEEAAKYYQERFRYVLVDEYQDVNRLQVRIIDKIAAQGQIMAVGDDAQCIYTWRGAEFEHIIGFSKRYPEVKIYKIETNYRSSPEILALANGILEAQPKNRGYQKTLLPSKPSGGRPVFAPLMDAYQQADFVIDRILELQDAGVDLEDVAVLYRAHYHAMNLQLEMTRQGIPFIITSGVRFFEQAHVKDLSAQLRFVANPADVVAFHRFACLLPKIGEKTASRLHSLAEKVASDEQISILRALATQTFLKKVPNDAQDDWQSLVETLLAIEEAARTATPAKVVEIAMEGWYSFYLRQTYDNWARREEDLESLSQFASKFQDLSEMLAQLILLGSETGDRVVRMGEQHVRLSTIHQAKGLEYRYVFVIGLAEGLFPIRRAIEGDGDLEEERRLFYVAATRAQQGLFLTYPMLSEQKGAPVRMQPSRFIREMPTEQLDVRRPMPKQQSSYGGYGRYGRGGGRGGRF